MHINICVGGGTYCRRDGIVRDVVEPAVSRLFNAEDTRQFPRTSALAATVKVTRRRLRALSNHFREVSYSSLRTLRYFHRRI